MDMEVEIVHLVAFLRAAPDRKHLSEVLPQVKEVNHHLLLLHHRSENIGNEVLNKLGTDTHVEHGVFLHYFIPYF